MHHRSTSTPRTLRALPVLLALMTLCPALAMAEMTAVPEDPSDPVFEVGAKLRGFQGSDPDGALLAQGLLRLGLVGPGEGWGYQVGMGAAFGGTPDGFAWGISLWQGFGTIPDPKRHEDIGFGFGLLMGVSGRQVTFPRLEEGIITEHGWGIELGLGVELNIRGRVVVRPDLSFQTTLQSSTTPCKDEPGKCEPIVDLPRGPVMSLSAGWLF